MINNRLFLYRSLPLNSCVAMHSFEVVYDASDPSFTVGKREDRSGTYITWTRDDVKTLKRGDRCVSIAKREFRGGLSLIGRIGLIAGLWK